MRPCFLILISICLALSSAQAASAKKTKPVIRKVSERKVSAKRRLIERMTKILEHNNDLATARGAAEQDPIKFLADELDLGREDKIKTKLDGKYKIKLRYSKKNGLLRVGGSEGFSSPELES